MLNKHGLAVAFVGMAKTGIKSPASIKFMIPGNWMIVAIGATFVAGLIQIGQHFYIGVDVAVIVPFIKTFPSFW